MVVGLAYLQSGDVDRALELLGQAHDVAFGAGSDAATNVALAMALVAGDRASDALALLTDSEATLVTYADRFRHGIVSAFARVRTGDAAGADRALQAAMAEVDGSGSVLDRAIGRFALAALCGTSPRGEAAAAEALDLVDRMGVRPVGWERVFELMAGGTAISD